MRSIAAFLTVVLTVTFGAGIAGAAPSQSQIRNQASAWLTAQVTSDGALISAYSGDPDPASTAQGVLALAGSGGDPATVAKMIGYLEAHVEDYVAPGGAADSPGALAWLILDAVATGGDPGDFGGVDLVARLEATQQPTGLFGTGDPTYDGAFRQGLSLIALDAVGETNSAGVDWLRTQQCADGGFVAFRTDTTVACPAVDPSTFTGEDTNSTALAAMALHDSGDQSAAAAAIAWLDRVRTPQGGFAYLGDPSQAMDGNSTGLVLLALTTVNGTPDSQAVAALASLQVPESGDAADRGGIAYQPQGTQVFPDLMATIQALLGLAGQALPFTPAPPVTSSTTTTTTTTTTVAPVSSSTIPAGRGTDDGSATAGATPSAAPATPVAGSPTYAG